MRQLKQLMALVLVLVLLFPAVAFANEIPVTEELQQQMLEELPASAEQAEFRKLEGEELEAVQNVLDERTVEDPEELQVIDEEEEVRVLIELSEEPVINVATRQGVSVPQMTASSYQRALNTVETEQVSVETKLEALDAKIDGEHSFQVVINGLTAEVPFGNIEKIEELAEVKNVYLLNEYERPAPVDPSMDNSVDMVKAPEAWNLSRFKGEGSVVAVIDSGVDVNHKDWVITDESKVALTAEEISAAEVPGAYHSAKIPYMYDYYDRDQNTKETGSSHGMHVAGTIAANGEIKGVAPEAQILAMKVFSSDTQLSTVFSDIYLMAMEDAVKLGADAVNLSLGSPAGIYQRDDASAENQAINNLKANGVVTVIANGNDRTITDGYPTPMPYESPDIGTAGSPAINKNSFAVASIDNTHEQMTMLIATLPSGEEVRLPMLVNADSKAQPSEEAYPLVYAGLGTPEEFPADTEGKAALIMRGEFSFSEKIKNAEAAGATAVIIYNNIGGGDTAPGMDLGGYEPKVPVVSLGFSDGEVLRTALEEGDVSVIFDYTPQQVEKPTAEQISDFSSWGPTSDLRMKPEITAPGGSINSTQNDDTYGYMSGTSMATPHVAGGVGVVHQALKANWGLSGEELADISKIVMMNTANPVSHPVSGYPYSVMEQGAGLMNVAAAVTTPVYVTATGSNDTEADAKLELKDGLSGSFEYTLNFTNKSDEDVVYTLSASAQTPVVEEGLFTETHRSLELSHSNDGTTVTVPANSTATISGTITVPEAPVNQYLNGFITLSNPDIDLSVPYLGFNGDWGEPKIFDNRVDEVYDGPSFFGYAQLTGETPQSQYAFLNIHDEKINDEYVKFVGPNRLPNPIYSLLRNTESIKHTIEDENGSLLRNINTERLVRKINRIYAGNPVYRLNAANTWDGTIRGKDAEEGKFYYYTTTATLNYDAEAQVVKHPMVWDSQGPELQGVGFNGATNEVQVLFNDEHAGTDYIMVLDPDYNVIGEIDISTFEEPMPSVWERNYEEGSVVNIPIGDYEGEVLIGLVDRINNQSVYNVGSLPGYGLPEMTITSPGLLTAHNVDTVDVTGIISGTARVDRVVIEVLDYETSEVVGGPVEATVAIANGQMTFTAEDVPFGPEDGPYVIRATAYGGDYENSVSTYVIVDREDPTMELTAVEETTEDNADITIDVSDNYWYLFIEEVFGETSETIDEVEFPGSPTFATKFTEYSVERNVPLEMGENTFTFRVTDIAGNTTEESIVITLVDGEDDPETPTEPTPDVDKSELIAKVAEAELLNPEDYQDGVEELEAAIEKAKAVIDDPDATQEEVNQALEELLAAIEGLVPVEPTTEVDKSKLKELLDDAKALNPDDYKDGVEELEQAIEDAEAVLADPDATQEEVDRALEDLIAAIEGLVPVEPTTGVDKSKLKELLDDAKALNPDDYKDGVEELEQAIEDAEAVLADPNATQQEVDDAVKALEEAIKNLVKKDPVTPDPEDPTPDPDPDPEVPVGPEIDTIAGDNRYLTSVEISKETFKTADTVILANGQVFADALVAGSYASILESPILLTAPDKIDHAVVKEIERLGAEKVIILGGTFRISQTIENELKDDYTVERIFGETRYETAVKIAERVMEVNPDATPILANGEVFADALAANTIAVAERAPIILTTEDKLHEAADAFLDKHKSDAVIVIGGELVIEEEVIDALDDIDVTRLYGENRYLTALAIAKHQYETPVNVFLTTGRFFADALAAAPALVDEGVILLADYDEVLPAVKDYMKDAETITIIGGPKAIDVDLKF